MNTEQSSSSILRTNKGFTLIEILIVVMVLGILAMVIIPQITVSTTDAKESTLSTNTLALRNAIELYYHQHNNVYPGYYVSTGTAKTLSVKTDGTDFIPQLTQYTDVDGLVSVSKTGAYIYGPYLKSKTLPVNPFVTVAADAIAVVCDLSITDVTARTNSGTKKGWKFYTITGVLMADDGAHDDL